MKMTVVSLFTSQLYCCLHVIIINKQKQDGRRVMCINAKQIIIYLRKADLREMDFLEVEVISDRDEVDV